MPVTINDYELSDAAVERELTHCQDSEKPWEEAVNRLVIRRLLLERAWALGYLPAGDEPAGPEQEDQAFEQVLAEDVRIPEPTSDECARTYAEHSEQFRVGALVAASHILFQVTERVDLEALREEAGRVLAELQEDPQDFAEAAERYSNCPSGQVGGSLGQLRRGDTVPEFERALFTAPLGTVHPHLVETRFGLHILLVHERDPGRLLPFEQVQEKIGQILKDLCWRKAVQQYLQRLIGGASITGIELRGSTGPLVQ